MLKCKRSGKLDGFVSQKGAWSRATRGLDAKTSMEADWATNPMTLGKDSYNCDLLLKTWGYLTKAGSCYNCFQKWQPGHVCDDAVARELLLHELSSNTFELFTLFLTCL